jgi:D-3-phosphoglycerate dehydrogenase / 2-oxoglutarate reductase
LSHRVLLTGEIHPDGQRLLQEHCNVRIASSTSRAELAHEASEVEALVLRANARVDRPLLRRAERLQVVGRYGAGVDNIDLVAAAEFGIAVVNTPGANAQSVAEHALASLLALSRDIRGLDSSVRCGDWSRRDRSPGREMHGGVLGVVGFGDIGVRLARACHLGLGMDVTYWDNVRRADIESSLCARRLALHELLEQSDVVSLHVPLTAATRNLIGAPELDRMKPDGFLLNLARGGIVDESALAAALHRGHLAGAALDVFVEEPLPPSSPLLAAPRLLLTPHAAALSEQACSRMAQAVAGDVLRVLRGQEPEHPVVLPRHPRTPLTSAWEGQNRGADLL